MTTCLIEHLVTQFVKLAETCPKLLKAPSQKMVSDPTESSSRALNRLRHTDEVSVSQCLRKRATDQAMGGTVIPRANVNFCVGPWSTKCFREGHRSPGETIL